MEIHDVNNDSKMATNLFLTHLPWGNNSACTIHVYHNYIYIVQAITVRHKYKTIPRSASASSAVIIQELFFSISPDNLRIATFVDILVKVLH